MIKSTLRAAAVTGAAALLAAGTAGTALAAPGTGTAGSRWTQAELPTGHATLLGSAAPDAHTVWAVGATLVDRGPGRTPGFSPVLYAKDTRPGLGSWKTVPTAKGVPVRMNAVAAVSDRDGWLVGDQGADAAGAGVGGVYTEHWNGRTWSVQQLALPSATQSAGLLSVSAVNRSNAWAVGWVQLADPSVPGKPQTSHDEGLVAHWTGKAWQRVTLPHVNADWSLSSITALSPDDVWAVGVGAQGDRSIPLALHYDGRSWSVQRDAAFAGFSGSGGLAGVAAHGRNDVWAVGGFRAPGTHSTSALVEHWDGRRWTRITAPADAGNLTGVAAAPGGIVAVGSSDDDAGDAYGLRVENGRVASLGLPANTSATEYGPWAVGYYHGLVTVIGALDLAGESLPRPMVLTGRG
ncbi:hypothetical protein [Streptacidiphilus rugosus]|uniref:hypothetical protein n=1 Tax=Streptacidiphilus rugosus TaxID=405783 RepID=UPI00055D1463|nr:hypothetical protein [Streptacidiphilus rugosus]